MIKFTLADTEYTIENTNIEDICLFGSFSRGENDNLSDIDILILIEDNDDQSTIDLKVSLSEQMNIPLDWLSIYRVSTFEHMAEKGSYFLWHLKLEGKILYSKKNRLAEILENLRRYKEIRNDLNEYAIICDDISEAIKNGQITIDYELSLLASIVRNTCIAIAYMNSKYLFGRVSPVNYCLTIIDSPELFSIEEYLSLYNFRINYIRPNNSNEVVDGNLKLVLFWLKKVQFLLDYAILKLEGSE